MEDANFITIEVMVKGPRDQVNTILEAAMHLATGTRVQLRTRTIFGEEAPLPLSLLSPVPQVVIVAPAPDPQDPGALAPSTHAPGPVTD
ncbi:hypothetical protein EVJ58_g264 [Rhodofomes roseus]|uniref:Uncharacterized protein n=1 Tax=Rhodofomes roseus TaxID=34475 RepID=A0A4Y9Z779_9APHY|nr:hypothetical protein EVJ58_g264 [Rhodofomes roseus]